MTTKNQLYHTKNYRLFKLSAANRALDMKKHRALYRSLKTYGYLKSYPIVCKRTPDKQLEIVDGQHRLAASEELDLEVWYIVTDTDFDISTVNSTAKPWTVHDHVGRYAAEGRTAYVEILDFAARHGLPLTVALSMLGGTVSWSNFRPKLYAGDFQIIDKEWAERTAAIYSAMAKLSPAIKNSRFMSAVMAIMRLPDIDPTRLISGAERCRDKLGSYSTRDAYLEMLEYIYNFGRHSLVPIKMPAIQAMRERNPTPKNTSANP